MIAVDNLPGSAKTEPFHTTPQEEPFGESVSGGRIACTLFSDGRVNASLLTGTSPMSATATTNGGVYLTMTAEQADALERHLSVCRTERQRRAV